MGEKEEDGVEDKTAINVQEKEEKEEEEEVTVDDKME